MSRLWGCRRFLIYQQTPQPQALNEAREDVKQTVPRVADRWHGRHQLCGRGQSTPLCKLSHCIIFYLVIWLVFADTRARVCTKTIYSNPSCLTACAGMQVDLQFL